MKDVKRSFEFRNVFEQLLHFVAFVVDRTGRSTGLFLLRELLFRLIIFRSEICQIKELNSFYITTIIVLITLLCFRLRLLMISIFLFSRHITPF